MTDNEMSQQERDAATLATIREFMDTTKDHDKAQSGHSIRDGTRAMLRIIDALAADRDRLRADNDALRTACAGVPVMLWQAGNLYANHTVNGDKARKDLHRAAALMARELGYVGISQEALDAALAHAGRDDGGDGSDGTEVTP